MDDYIDRCYEEDYSQECQYQNTDFSSVSREDKAELYRLQRAEEKRLSTLNKYRFSGSKHKVYIEITIPVLSQLFNVKEATIRKWISRGKIDPSNLLNIIEKYNTGHLLDKRYNRDK